MPDANDTQPVDESSQQRRFDDACDAFAEFILEAIENTFDASSGRLLHPETRTDGDLIAILNRGTTDAHQHGEQP